VVLEELALAVQREGDGLASLDVALAPIDDWDIA
jgi:hypothetical protein